MKSENFLSILIGNHLKNSLLLNHSLDDASDNLLLFLHLIELCEFAQLRLY